MKVDKNDLEIGDIFIVNLGEKTLKYFQYISDDITQLSSNVIRAFKKVYLKEETDLTKIVEGEIDFYAHIVIKSGLKSKLWYKVGNKQEIGNTGVMFRTSLDYGNPSIKVSKRWQVWEVNQPPIFIGKLNQEFQKLDIGTVVTPHDVIERLKSGSYNFFYPSC